MAGGAETSNIAALPAIARLGACESARGPDADRRVKLLIQFAVEGSLSGAYSHLNLAYRWFCRLGLDGEVPDHSTFSKNRHGRFRDCDLLRKLAEQCRRLARDSTDQMLIKSLIELADEYSAKVIAIEASAFGKDSEAD
jgi:hypothetical protein